MKAPKISQKIIDKMTQNFSVTPEDARTYLINVQSLFVLHKPRLNLIVDILLTEKFTVLPSPHQLADVIRNTWTENPSRLSKFTDKPLSSKAMLEVGKKDSYDLLFEMPAQKNEPEQRDKDRPKVIRKTINDEGRVSPKKLPHCPHGVPRGKICAICDPERFREYADVD
jgi:hypothetical protein